MRFLVCGAVLSAAFIGVVTYALPSKATGLTGLHKQVQAGDKVCFADHFHFGESGAWSSRPSAVANAARSWAWLPALEYGHEWARFELAADQSMQCTQVEGNRKDILWSCKAKARPCRQALPEVAVAGHATVAVVPHVREPMMRAGHHHRVRLMHRAIAAPYAAHHLRASQIWPGDKR